MGVNPNSIKTLCAVKEKAARVLPGDRPIKKVQHAGKGKDWTYKVIFALDKLIKVTVLANGEEFAVCFPKSKLLRKQKPGLPFCMEVVKYYFYLQTGRVIDKIHPIGPDHEWKYVATLAHSHSFNSYIIDFVNGRAGYDKPSGTRCVHLITEFGFNSIYVSKRKMGGNPKSEESLRAVMEEAAHSTTPDRRITKVQHAGSSNDWYYEVVMMSVDKFIEVTLLMCNGEEFTVRFPKIKLLRKQKPGLKFCKEVVKYYFNLQTGHVIDQMHPIGPAYAHQWKYVATYAHNQTFNSYIKNFV